MSFLQVNWTALAALSTIAEREPKEISIDLAFLFKIPRRCFCSIHQIRWAKIISFAQSITIIRISRLLDRLYDRTTLFVKVILSDLNFLEILKSFPLFESRTKKWYLILSDTEYCTRNNWFWFLFYTQIFKMFKLTEQQLWNNKWIHRSFVIHIS